MTSKILTCSQPTEVGQTDYLLTMNCGHWIISSDSVPRGSGWPCSWCDLAHTDRVKLWDLLDDIDTLSDATEDPAIFQREALKLANQRFDRATSNGYNLTWLHEPTGLDPISA